MRLSAPALLLSCLGLNTATGQRTRLTPPAPSASETREHTVSLPVTRVSLYKNGVGFFEHSGHVTGDASVTIDFTTDQLNDVLQSLTALDLNGGRIAGAGYNSTTPLDQQLKSLPLALNADTTAADFYASIRGSRVEVRAPGVSIVGRLLSVEDRNAAIPRPSGEDAENSSGPKEVQAHFLTVVSDAGEVRTVQLTQQTSVRLLDTALHQDVSRYLRLLADNRSQGLRHLTLEDHGTGTRELQVSYISAVPVWKSTYRILFTDSKSASSTATLQGWAVVDNTVGEDWTNVQLSLIAGRPQSFTQPLSDPIYTTRPEIPIATAEQLAPTVHESGIGATTDSVMVTNGSVEADSRVRAQAHASPKMMSASRVAGVAGMSGMAGGTAMSIGGPLAAPAPPPPSYEELAQASIAPQTQTAAFDDFFQYRLSQPITIRKNESALVPILQTRVPADRVTLVTTNGYAATGQPLRALWITNDSGLTLDRGSFSLVENGSFGGEGLLDPIHPNEKRLLSYAADEAVHVSTEAQSGGSRVVGISAAKGVLIIRRAETREITYVLHNSAADARTIVLEHPVEAGLTLTSDLKPTETTATTYRFRLEAGAGQTARLHIGGRRATAVSYRLTQSDDNQLAYILNSTDQNPALVRALQPVLDARRRVEDAQTAVNQTNATRTALKADEERQRANITALATAAKASRDRFVADLDKTEDALSTQQKDLATRTAALDAAKADLASRIESLQINETI